MSTKNKSTPTTPRQTKKARLVTPERSKDNESLIVEPKTLYLGSDGATDTNATKTSQFNLSSIASLMKKEEEKADEDSKKGMLKIIFKRSNILDFGEGGVKVIVIVDVESVFSNKALWGYNADIMKEVYGIISEVSEKYKYFGSCHVLPKVHRNGYY